jgi:conjugative transfer signal peptidase TraF
MSRVTFFGWRRSTHGDRARRILLRLGAIVVLLAILPELGTRRALVINTSPSVAPGLYLRSSDEPAVGKLVDFCIPPAARDYVRGRTGNSGENWYILKPIVAGPGDWVDTTGDSLIVNGHRIAPMPPRTDGNGRPLPIWRKRCLLTADEFFVFSNRITNSFDSRCYGPIRRQQIETVRRALITW